MVADWPSPVISLRTERCGIERDILPSVIPKLPVLKAERKQVALENSKGRTLHIVDELRAHFFPGNSTSPPSAAVSGERHTFWSSSGDEWCPVPDDAHTVKYLYFENLAGHAGDLGAETRSHCHQQLPQIKQQLWVTSDPRGHLPLAGTLERWFQSAVVSIADSLHGILDSLLDSLPPGASQPSLPICRFAAVPYPVALPQKAQIADANPWLQWDIDDNCLCGTSLSNTPTRTIQGG